MNRTVAGYSEFTLAEVIAASLDGEYDDENDVFTSATVENGFRIKVAVTSEADWNPTDRHFVVTVEEITVEP